MTDFTGGCACGAIRYKAVGKPRYMGNCHCRDCQQATGSAYFPGMGFKSENFSLEKGEPKWFTRQADRGHAIHRAFCSDCGSPLFIRNDISKYFTVLYAGSLDDPRSYQPARDIFVRSAQPWNQLDPSLPKSDEMPS